MFEVPARFIRAAQLCQAKKDVPPQLNGVHITEDGYIEGCNRHVLYRGRFTTDPMEDMIVDIHGTIPASAKTVTFYIGEKSYCETEDRKNMFACDLIAGKYPNTSAMIPEKRTEFSGQFSCCSKYLSLISSVFGGSNIRCEYGMDVDKLIFTAEERSEFANHSLIILQPVLR